MEGGKIVIRELPPGRPRRPRDDMMFTFRHCDMCNEKINRHGIFDYASRRFMCARGAAACAGA